MDGLCGRNGIATLSLLAGCLGWVLCGSAVGQEAPATPFSVGHDVTEFRRTEANGDPPPLTVALWYPTRSAVSRHKYNDPYETPGLVALAAAPAPGPHPLIVYSHGYGGAGIASAYLMEYLASQGFVIAAPDHEDKNVICRTKPDQALRKSWYSFNVIKLARSGNSFDHQAYRHRCKDVSLVVDEMLRLNKTEGSPFKGTMDPGAIGIIGHSLGGYTALCVCGIRPEDKVPPFKAALLLSGGVFMFKGADYGRIRLPVMFMFGEVETAHWRTLLLNDKVADTKRAYDHCPPPKYMMELKSANHFSFCQALFDRKWPGLGPQKSGPVADAIKTYSLAFMRRYLLGDRQAQAVLDAKSPLFLRYEKQTE